MNAEMQTAGRIETNFPLEPFSLNFRSARLTDEQFEELCRHNRDLKFELSAKGELIIVPPTSPESGWRNFDLNIDFGIWTRRNGTGIAFDSSTMFTLPNGAKRSPDVSWMTLEKWHALSLSERQKFARVVPDFVIELRSPSDSLEDLREKMAEYIENGVRLGWLIDPLERRVHIYRANGEIEILENHDTIRGEDFLHDFEFQVSRIW